MKNLKKLVGTLEQRMGVEKHETRKCEIHGDYTAALVRGCWSGCDACVRARDTEAALGDLEAARLNRSQRILERLLGHAAIPKRFADRTLDNYVAETDEQRQVLAQARDYAERFPEHLAAGRCLFMFGPPGTGKTHLAAAIASYVIQHHQLAAVYSTVAEMARRFKDNYSTRETTEKAIIEAFAGPDLLILDEVGASWGSQTELMYLFEVVNARYEQRKPTLFAGNLSRAEVRAAVGDRVADRLNENGGIRLNFKWESARK